SRFVIVSASHEGRQTGTAVVTVEDERTRFRLVRG
ncbi:MAG: hypothetical protein ACI80N_001683, partial [Gammaproteobacteria bacterium]